MAHRGGLRWFRCGRALDPEDIEGRPARCDDSYGDKDYHRRCADSMGSCWFAEPARTPKEAPTLKLGPVRGALEIQWLTAEVAG